MALQSILVVEDEPDLRCALVAVLQSRAAVVAEAGSVAEAGRFLAEARPDVVVLDVALADGTAFDVLQLMRASAPMPRVIAISGSAGPEVTFRLAELGVRAFVAKPLQTHQIEAALDRVMSSPPDLVPLLRASVGLRSICDIEAEVRQTLVNEAIARSKGSKRGAAGLLSISRQLLQHILRHAS